jgi:uncharacterized protein YciI
LPLFVVTYEYTADLRAQDELRPRHRDFIRELDANVASGPTDAGGAFLIFDATSAEEVEGLLDADPFKLAGFVRERRVVAWTPVLGRWVADGRIP